MNQFFLFGLGNPGREYFFTRHNVGYLFITYFFRKQKLKEGKGNFLYLKKENLIGILPTLYMNENGKIIEDLKRSFDFNKENLIVFLDDFNLPFGSIRFRFKGSAGGHRGLESVIYHMGTENFKRLRIGIGFDYNYDAKEYVLMELKEEEKKFLKEKVFPYIEEGIYKFLIKRDFNNFANYINNYPWKERVQTPEKEKEEKE